MAGTRFLVQAVFTVEFLVVLGVALYGGILSNPRDRLSIAVFQQGGRFILSKLMKTSPILSYGKIQEEKFAATSSSLFSRNDRLMPTAKLLCQESQIVFWKDIIQKSQSPTDKTAVEGDGTSGLVSKICETPELLLLQQQEGAASDNPATDADLIVCEFWIPRDRARLVLVGGTLVFYSRSIGKRQEDMSQIYPQQLSSSTSTSFLPDRVDLVLAVDSRRTSTDWKEWVLSLEKAYSKHQQSWQAILRSSDPINFDVTVVDSSFNTNHDDDSRVHQIDSTNLQNMFGIPPAGNRLQVILYLSPFESASFGSLTSSSDSATEPQPSTMLTQGSRLIEILLLASPSTDARMNTRDMVARKAMDHATDWITRRCLGIPTTTSDNRDIVVDEETLDDSVPRWYWKIWWQRQLSHLNRKAIEMAQDQARVWTQSSIRVPITTETVTDFRDNVLHVLEHTVPALLANQSYAQALEAMETTIDLMIEWRRDETFMPPLDFPPEQYAAIFAPLALPLLLPLLVGLVREYKRYREYQEKKKKSKVPETTNAEPQTEDETTVAKEKSS